MRSVKSFIAAGAATLLSSAAFAADMAIAPPPVCAPRWSKISAAGICAATSASAISASRRSNWLPISQLRSVDSADTGFDTAGIFGLGVGYRFNNWFRADVIGAVSRQVQLPRHRRRLQLSRRPTSASTPITAASPSGWFWPTPTWISVPGGASPRSSVPASAAPHHDHRIHATRRHCRQPAASPTGVSPTRTTVKVEFRLGRCMPVSPTRSPRASPSNWPIAT